MDGGAPPSGEQHGSFIFTVSAQGSGQWDVDAVGQKWGSPDAKTLLMFSAAAWLHFG